MNGKAVLPRKLCNQMLWKEEDKVRGDIAWAVMALSITLYDVYAIKSKKAETMSGALWRSLKHPFKFPIATIIWGVLTYHLFAGRNARTSIKVLPGVVFKKNYYFYE